MQWNGRSIRSLAQNEWETKVVFDDSILQDRQTDINEGISLVGNKLMSKMKFMVDKLGYTEEEAAIEIKRIAEEDRITGTAIDFLSMGGDE